MQLKGGVLQSAGRTFGGTPQPVSKRQAVSRKVGSFGGGSIRRPPLKSAVAAFQLDSDDDDEQ